jgi:hypothetical protein
MAVVRFVTAFVDQSAYLLGLDEHPSAQPDSV